MSGPQVVVFAAGASGDVTQVNNLSPLAEREPEDGARFVGGRVGAESVNVLLSAPSSSGFRVAAKSRLLSIPRRKPAPSRTSEAYEIVARKREDTDHAKWIFAKETVLLDAKIAKEPSAEVETLPFSFDTGKVKGNRRRRNTQPGWRRTRRGRSEGLHFNYVPTEEAFRPNGAGYETRLSAASNLEVRAGTRIADAPVELCRSLSPDRTPEMRRAAARDPQSGEWMRAPWSYGSLPSELE